MKTMIISITLLVMVFGTFIGNANAFNQTKYDAFVKKTLQSVVDQVNSDGKSAVTKQKFVKKYDTNQDGFINANEAEKIQDFLNQNY
ncbi:MAG: hypothetical protein A3G33_09685 [Omnitrophica bacterium RIFCSPLOWO2_12_FULL_44_17]|uniref:EF-hand domain-containing protein n=1 Tax=Candidatus Danuiimicrobium aquiferis TaxID=1801832 RepID=A0A1G1KX03_9BACT|nr:MAG: hypothetical protein A3E74_02620 [Omnitrophica bacterium RIFCSPHIGHO2_12_FULL_44_12]OGW97450.1 MAG: hypothetical protein A3G33_09685 [Omnitrophica bacterium RIFCSPLOWO2_12_FULL_44_17]OGX04523.1 MAG: hypothetical protein A3J12_10725 [Omnitrophica bacterium RIFCSPLOWO2_02_FULL_44_11]